jgi:hypothetical protein
MGFTLLPVVTGTARYLLWSALALSLTVGGPLSAADKLKFKIDLKEKDNGTVDADVKNMDNQPATEVAGTLDPVKGTTVYDFMQITAFRLEGNSSCTVICKTLSNGTRTCYKQC